MIKRLPVVRGAVARVQDARAETAAAREDAALARAELAEASAGFCHCCRQSTEFEITGPWLRDEYRCRLCGSIPRQRHLQYILDRFLPGWEQSALHESSPSNDFIAGFSRAYSSSQFLDPGTLGSVIEGVRNESLEALSFDDATFDIVVTQDVFEHLPHPDVAAREIHRVLKPGGVHVFTAPRYGSLVSSRPRVEQDGTPFFAPQYHGNPVGDGRALVTWDYGADFEERYAQWCGASVRTHITIDRRLGLDAEHLDVFVARRGAAPREDTAPPEDTAAREAPRG